MSRDEVILDMLQVMGMLKDDVKRLTKIVSTQSKTIGEMLQTIESLDERIRKV